VLAANLISWPLAWYAMNGWLTVALQILKSARTNPVDALYFE
jgi:hypothetical protein